MYEKANILRTVGNLFYGSYDYLINVLTGVDSFDELVETEWALKKNPVYRPGRGFNIERDLSDYVAITKKAFNILRAKIESNIYNKSDIRTIKKFLQEYMSLNKPTQTFLNEYLKEMESGKYKESVLFLPFSPIFHAYHVYNSLLQLNKEKKLDNALQLVNKLHNNKLPLKGGDGDMVVESFLKVLKEKKIELSKNQVDTLKKCLENTFVALDGVPGSGKTTMLAIFFLLISSLLLRKKEKVNVVFTANTYAALKEFLRKISDLLSTEEIRKFFKEIIPINIYAFLKEELCNCSANKEDFCNIKKTLDELSKERVVNFYCSSSRTQVKEVNEGVNIIVLPISKLRFYYTKAIEIKAPVDVLMIDEVSQVSGFSAIEVLSKINLADNSRIIMTGDKSQLPPIYSVIEDEIPLYSVGTLYNLYTFFQDKYLLCNLWETRRLPKGIVEVIRDLYDCIESRKSTKCQIRLKKRGILENILGTNDLSIFSLIRIKLLYPEELQKYRRSNEFEVKIIKKLLSEISSETKVAIMTPFRDQEAQLQKEIRSKECIIGTVDKLQGREVQLGIVSLVSTHPIYTKEVVSFICTPNRLNVALTRASETTILIHSDVLEKEVEVAFDSEGIEKAKEMAIGYKKFKIPVNDISKILKDSPALNYELGFQMMRKFFRLTEYVGKLSLSNSVVAEIYAYKDPSKVSHMEENFNT